MRGSRRRAAGGVAMHAEYLRIGIVRCRIAAIEDDLDLAVWQHRRIGTLIEITGMRTARWVKEVTEET